MSSKPNHRRGHDRIQDNGPTFEGGPPCSGCNSTHVAKSRSDWRTMGRRAERRTGKRGANGVMHSTGAGLLIPEIEDDWGEEG
jgi:hypothetical protein